MQSRIGQLMGIDYKFDLMLSEDGSGRGAALVAAVLKREDMNRESGLGAGLAIGIGGIQNGDDDVFRGANNGTNTSSS
jgi:hypothetical protein